METTSDAWRPRNGHGRRVADRAAGVALAALVLLASPVLAETTLFDWSEDACARWDIPDTPARFWREDDGVAMISGSEESRVSRGPDVFSMVRDCDVAFRGGHDPDPQDHDDRAWIHATWAHPSGRVEALAHVEYHGHRHHACAADEYMPCWRNSIVALESPDGETFRRADAAPVAALPYAYDAAQERRSGYFNPSNIFRRGDYLHAFVFAEAYGAQRRGACLLRRPIEGGAWRAWDGEGFGAVLSGLSRAVRGDTCAPVGGVTSTLSSVVHDGRGGFLAVTPRTVEGRAGIWLQRSADLLSWTPPELLVEAPLLWRRNCAAPAVYGYPALVAPDSRSRNFDTIEDEVWLTAVRMPLDGECGVGPERDLVAWRLRRTGDGGLELAEAAP